MQLIFETSVPGRRGVKLPASDVPRAEELSSRLLRGEAADLPEVSELELVRHYTNLSRRNYSVDTTFYPLGSCTMKYNPKVLEEVASLFARFHPMTALLPGGEEYCQGSLGLLYDLGQLLADITGMDQVCTQPLAGAHGEMTGIMVIAARHRERGKRKRYVLVPDSSHGTNPATAAMAGFQVVTVPTAAHGDMDLGEFDRAMNDEVAAVMMTCPNTLGLFNPRVAEICRLAHSRDALVYCDGANLNAILGKVRPGDIGFDLVHLNLHKTFATPHGGGGPGAGPLAVKGELVPYLPLPRIVLDEVGVLRLVSRGERSIGRAASFLGNFAVLARAYAYIVMLGREGLVRVSERAVLNANYIRARLKGHYELPFEQPCMHECVFSASRQTGGGARALDIAKFLIDRGFHPPTIYFPLIVKEALMIEPTETESRATLDRFVEAMIEAADLAENDPQRLLEAPLTMPVSRLDETRAAREPRLCHCG